MTKLNGIALGTVVAAMGLPLAGQAQAVDTVNKEPPVTHTIGLGASDYEYREPGVMSLEAIKVGFDYSATVPFSTSWYFKGDFSYAYGRADYESVSTGSSDDHKDWHTDARALVGYDFKFGSHAIGPYSGVGYRILSNDLRGTSSTGHTGYRRLSQYYYLPIGMAHRWSFGERVKLTTTIEYDYLVKGQQTTKMGDVYEGTTTPAGTTLVSVDDAKNEQKHGYGYRASIMMGIGNWTFGPYASYWRIDDSEDDDNIEAVDDVGDPWVFTGAVYEPKNRTREAGFKVFYSF